MKDELKSAQDKLIEVARAVYGEGKYKYYAIPVSWRGTRKKGEHFYPITGLDKFEVDKEKWSKCQEESDSNRTGAFMGKLKSSYTRYDKRCIVDGWREKLAEWGKAVTTQH